MSWNPVQFRNCAATVIRSSRKASKDSKSDTANLTLKPLEQEQSMRLLRFTKEK